MSQLFFSVTEVTKVYECCQCGKSLHDERRFFIFNAERTGACTGGNTLCTVDVTCCKQKQVAPLALGTAEEANAFCNRLNEVTGEE